MKGVEKETGCYFACLFFLPFFRKSSDLFCKIKHTIYENQKKKKGKGIKNASNFTVKIVVGNQTIELWDREVAAAKKMAVNCINSVHQQTTEKKWPTLYFTFLLVLHMLSAELIDEISPEAIQQILNINYRHKVNVDNKNVEQTSEE